MAEHKILDKLEGIKEKFTTLGQQITDPNVMSDMKRYIQLSREYKELSAVVKAADKFRTAVDNLQEAKTLFANEKDEEMREMARQEIETLEPMVEQ
ncbi:MAG: PCRF domain-containing protein, partial [Mucinivorans sp.]